MGIETVLFKSEERHSRGDAAAFLRQLADKLEEGRVVLKKGEAETVLEPPESVTVEVKAEEESKGARVKRSLEVEIEWGVGDAASPGGGMTLG